METVKDIAPVTQPLRSDQIRRLNAYLATAAASAAAASAAAASAVGVAPDEAPPEHVDLPDPMDALALARRADLTLPLLESVGCHVAQLLAGNVPLSVLRKLGCDGLYLSARPVVTAQLVGRFGATAVATSALETPADALSLAGSMVATQLGLTPRLLLKTLTKPPPTQGYNVTSVPSVSDMALCVLDHELTRTVALLGERQRQTGRPAVIVPSVALFQCLNVSDLASVGLDASTLVRRYRVDVQTLAQALGACSVRELAPLGVVVV